MKFPSNHKMTPHILIQTWKTHSLPDVFEKYRQEWISYTPNFKHILFDDKEIRDFIIKYFPNYLKKFDSFTFNIEKVDFFRYAILYVLGGVYADLDTHPIKPIDKWVNLNKIVLGREPIEHANTLYEGREVVLCNAFMISPPKQVFWLNFMDFIMENYKPNYKPVFTTGPMAMTYFYEKYPEQFENTIITDPCVFFPLTGQRKVSKFCSLEKDSYVLHEWENSWVEKWYSFLIPYKEWYKDPKYWLILFLIIYLCFVLIKK